MFNWDDGVVIRELPAFAGIILFLCGYLLLQFEKIKGHSFSYSILNIAVAGLLLFVIGNYFENTGLFVGLLVVYLAISFSGIARQALLNRHVEFNPDERVILDAIAPDLPGVMARKLLNMGEWTRVEKGTVMTLSGQKNTHFYVLQYGSADISVDEEVVTTIHSVSLVGEMTVFTGDVALATVTAAENCVVYAFECNSLREFLSKNTPIRSEMERQISKHVSSNLNRANRMLLK